MRPKLSQLRLVAVCPDLKVGLLFENLGSELFYRLLHFVLFRVAGLNSLLVLFLLHVYDLVRFLQRTYLQLELLQLLFALGPGLSSFALKPLVLYLHGLQHAVHIGNLLLVELDLLLQVFVLIVLFLLAELRVL